MRWVRVILLILWRGTPRQRTIKWSTQGQAVSHGELALRHGVLNLKFRAESIKHWTGSFPCPQERWVAPFSMLPKATWTTNAIFLLYARLVSSTFHKLSKNPNKSKHWYKFSFYHFKHKKVVSAILTNYYIGDLGFTPLVLGSENLCCFTTSCNLNACAPLSTWWVRQEVWAGGVIQKAQQSTRR